MKEFIYLVLKTVCFINVFFWWKVPKKCLCSFYWLMVTLIKYLYNMGSICCRGKKPKDNYPKKVQSDVSSSGKFTYQSTNSCNYSQPGAKNSQHFGNVSQEIFTKSILPQNSTDGYISGSTCYEGSQQFPKGPVFGKSSLHVKEPGGLSPSSKTNLESYNAVESHHKKSAAVHRVSENYRKSSLRKHQIFSIKSLPNTRLAKTPVNNQELKPNRSSSYDSYLYSQGMPRMNVQDPYGKNPYLFSQNKPNNLSFYPTKELQLLKQQVMNIDYIELPGPSSNSYEQMETDRSAKRAITSYDTQDFGSIVDGYNIESDTINKRVKVAHPEKEPLSNEKILTELEYRLHERYNELLTSRQVHNFYFEVCTLKEPGNVERKFCSLSQLFPQNPNWRMLIYGKPFFGKTQLCHDITGNWHRRLTEEIEREFVNIRGFKILIQHCLSPESVKDLEKYFVDECHKLLPENFVSKDEFKNAWNTCMFGTLFILDGYDSLSSDERQYVNFSLRQNFFQEASVLLTCRPNADTELKQFFNIHADICGLSKTTLSELAKYKNQDNRFEDCKVENLYGISPFYAQAVVNCFNLDAKPKSLYNLLNSVMSFLTSSTKLNDLAFHFIGAFFLNCLRNRNFVFEEKQLKQQLSMFWNDLQSFGLFVTSTRKPNETRKVVVFHKLFMVYFSVRYLQKEWTNQKITAQRDVFLKAQLCFEDTSGVYLKTTEKTPKVYFAGVIPEVVFDFHKNAFQMIQDVSELDLSSAFETQSLLLRVDSKRLSTFGITEVENSNFENFFADLLNLLDFWGLTVEKKFYVATESPLYYLKIAVIDEDRSKQVMMSVASINPAISDQIQEIRLDFLESNIKLLHLFLQKFVKMFLGLLEVDSNMSAVDLVFHLVLLCLAHRHDLYTQLTLESRSPKLSNLVTWEIISSSSGKPASSFSYLNKNETILKEYDSVQCSNLPLESHSSKVIERMCNTVSGFSELGITINIKSNF